LCGASDSVQFILFAFKFMRLAFRDFAFIDHCGIAYGLAVFVTAA